MANEQPTEGRIVIDWKRALDADLALGEFTWEIHHEPPGQLTKDDASRLLRELAKRL